MVSKYALLFLVLNLIRNGRCWIFNNIDYKLLENDIRENKNREIVNELSAEDLMNLRFNLIYPGTRWCGPGNIADGYEDLGPAQEADICCRDHDNCPDTIPAGETKHNLTNEAYYTKLSCECDENFRQCLRKGNTKSTTTIGLMYFNVIGTQCFRRDYQITGCVKRGGWLNTKCLEYSYDTSSEMSYQWFDVPNYEH